jgi:hypothetical protein
MHTVWRNNMNKRRFLNFESLKGLALIDLIVSEDEEAIILEAILGFRFKLYHPQDCCEHVYVESIVGDIQDVLGAPLTTAEEVITTQEEPTDFIESSTHTFYKLDTQKGGITIRWVGESNGYYSETVTFEELP